MTETSALQDVPEERTRRMAVCFQAEAPTEAEVRAARQRYLSRREARGRASPAGYLLSMVTGAAATLGFVAAYAAFGPSDGIPITVSPELVETTAPAGPISAVRATDAYFEKNGVRDRAHDGLRETLAAGESGAIILGDSRTEVPGPGVIEFQKRLQGAAGWQVRFSHSETKAAASATDAQGARVPGRPAAAPAASEGSESGSWARVARALRDQDSMAAEHVLRQLAKEADVQTRQAAELALAQLQVAQGRKDEAKATLEQLAEIASAPIIRKRAADLLQQIK